MNIEELHSTLTPAHAAPCHFLRAAANGLIAQGHAVEFIPTTRWKRAPFPADAFVVWSAKNAASVVEVFPDARMIVMERGYYRDRNERCRIGKGAFGAALLEIAPETPERFFRFWGMPLPPRAAFRPLRSDVLLMAQVRTDSALHGEDYGGWIMATIARCEQAGLRPHWRPHPLDIDAPRPDGLQVHTGEMVGALRDYDRFATLSSGSAIDGVMAGLAVSVGSQKSPLWGVAPTDPASDWGAEIPWRRLYKLANLEHSIPELETGKPFLPYLA
jgi:hypothetical protein